MAAFCMESLPPLPSLLVALLRESEDYAEQAHVTRMLLVDHVRPPCGFFMLRIGLLWRSVDWVHH